MPALSIAYREIDKLKPFVGNARVHSPKQVTQLANSIATFGFTFPILVDRSCEIIAGHGRLLAARQLGLKSVPTIEIGHLSEPQVRALRIADNRLTERSSWDSKLLRREMTALSSVELDFDLTVTGFDAPEIDIILSTEQDASCEEPSPPAPPDPASAVSQAGDIWQIGSHRLLCGDVRDAISVEQLMGGGLAAQVFTDPPYNVRINGFAGGKGRVRHREFAHASGEMTEEGYAAFLADTLGTMRRCSRDGALAYVFIDWRHVRQLLDVGERVLGPLVNMAVWSKTNPGMGSFYRSAHELVPIFRIGAAPSLNNVQLGKYGRSRSNVWTYHSVNGFVKHRRRELELHPTPKPVLLIADAIKDCTRRGEIVFDGFAGSGATLVAAHRAGRVGYGVEIDRAYCDVIVTRLAQETGIEPVLSPSGSTFSKVRGQRLGVGEPQND